MRVVLDTAILVRASAKAKGPAREVLLAIVNGPHELTTSAFLLNETERGEFLRRISELVDVVVKEPVVRSDPDDDPVVYTEVDGRADVLCTMDGDLFQPGVVAFWRENNIAVMTDVELLRMLVPRVSAEPAGQQSAECKPRMDNL